MIRFNNQRLINHFKGDPDKIKEFGVRCSMTAQQVQCLLTGITKQPRFNTVVMIAEYIGEDSIDELVTREEL